MHLRGIGGGIIVAKVQVQRLGTRYLFVKDVEMLQCHSWMTSLTGGYPSGLL